MGERGWVRRFTEGGRPGAYLRVLAGGAVRAGDRVEVVHRPGHGVSVGAVFTDTAPDGPAALLEADQSGEIVLARSMRPYVARAQV